MRITKQLVGAGVVAILAGCSSLPSLSSLNPFSGKSKGNQPAALTELKGSMAVRTAWKADIGKSSDYWFTPAVVGNTVVVASGEGTLARFESASGRQMWRIKIDNPTRRRANYDLIHVDIRSVQQATTLGRS